MSINEPPMFITGCMTLTEACDHQRMLDTYWPDVARRTRWKDCKTGKRVSIGYTY